MGIKKSNVRLCVLMGFYILFIVIGASIFSAIEGPQERLKVKALRNTRTKFLTDNKCLTGCINEEPQNYIDEKFVDFEDLLKNEAWKIFKKTSRKKIPRHKLQIEVNLSKLKIQSRDPVYKPVSADFSNGDTPKSLILLTCKHSNGSNVHQSFPMEEEKTTTSTVKVAVQKGFFLPDGLSFKVPQKVIKETRVNETMTICNSSETEFTQETSVRWKMGSGINVPPKKTLKATITVEEVHSTCEFSMDTILEGRILYVFRDRKGEFLGTQYQWITAVYDQINRKLQNLPWGKKDGKVEIHTTGVVTARFQVDKRSKIEESEERDNNTNIPIGDIWISDASLNSNTNLPGSASGSINIAFSSY